MGCPPNRGWRVQRGRGVSGRGVLPGRALANFANEKWPKQTKNGAVFSAIALSVPTVGKKRS